MKQETYSTLVVTKDKKTASLINTMLMPPMFELTVCSDYNEGRRILSERNFSIIICDSGDGSDIDFAIDASNNAASTILLLAPVHHFDQISYRVESYGIITVTNPFDGFYFYNMIKAAIAVHFKIEVLSSQTTKLKEKMEEIRIINRAKMLLMEKNKFSEEEAHKYIEKQAMDRCIKRIRVAKQIIDN